MNHLKPGGAWDYIVCGHLLAERTYFSPHTKPLIKASVVMAYQAIT